MRWSLLFCPFTATSFTNRNTNSIFLLQRIYLGFCGFTKRKLLLVSLKTKKSFPTTEKRLRDNVIKMIERTTFGNGMLNKRNYIMMLYFKQKLDYLHFNSVKAGLCNLQEEYLYSSARILFREFQWLFVHSL